ncbi:tyrosine-type recombinase/integrase [Luteolibacter sp. Populi]|uniref:tyrosine-type recombinase/integrase n=1 Tax=Luteolibacter sp. Populi TaxID=3230487 RepID=UPI0034671754
MASLFKRPGSPFHFCAFDVTLPDGSTRRLKKSTKQRDRGKALKEALRIEELEKGKALGGTDMAAQAYGALTEAAQAAARGELSEARARQIIAKLSKASTGDTLRFFTVRSWAEEWAAGKAGAVKVVTAKRHRTSVKVFLAYLGPKAEGRLEAVTKADVRKFRDAIRKGYGGLKRSGSTVNCYLSDIGAMFRSAVDEDLLLSSPVASVERLPEDDRTEREVFTLAEVSRLVEAAGQPEWHAKLFPRVGDEEAAQRRAEWQGLIVMAFYLGPRLGDCSQLRWQDVDLDQGVISYMPTKTSRQRKRLNVPVHPRLMALLKDRHEDGAEGAVFPLLSLRGSAGKLGLSSQFSAIMEAGGIDRRKIIETTRDAAGKLTRKSVSARTFHSLRHSLTSQLANAGVAEELRKKITGHSSSAVHAGYTHLDIATLAAAIGKLPGM